jgi:2,4-dienoyl-CoA reductase
MSKIFPIVKSVLKLDSLKGKTVVITGGATGLGRKMAEHYASNDVNTIICSRNLDKLEETANHINSNYGDIAKFYQVDVADLDSVNNLFNNLNKDQIQPDILINNAAGNFISRTEDLSPNAINRIIDIVLKGTVNMTTNFSKQIMKENKFGTILNISTLYAETGSGFVIPSAISKAGVNTLTKSLAAEWGKYGIRTLAVAPGSIYTEGAFSRLDPTGEFKEKLKSVNPSGRLGEQEELANLVTFLTSDYCSWLNGQVINFDGGEGIFRAGQFNEMNSLDDSFWKMIRKK